MIDLQIIGLLFRFFDFQLPSLFGHKYMDQISSRGEEIIRFLVFRLIFFISSSLLFSVVFSSVDPNSTSKEILLYLVPFCP